jgi:PAS domain S-box-containing protein
VGLREVIETHQLVWQDQPILGGSTVDLITINQRGLSAWRFTLSGFWRAASWVVPARAVGRWQTPAAGRIVVQIAAVFLAYFIAGRLGQATTNIRSSNLGPVWPAYGIALAAFLSYGYRVWPGIAASAFVIAFSSSVPPLAAVGQAIGATVAGLTGSVFLRRFLDFDPSLSRLSDALGLVILGAFGSATLSASIGVFSLYVTHVQAYSGLASAWLIYWLGDSTGVLLITPLVFTLPELFRMRSRAQIQKLVALLILLAVTCFLVFGDLELIPIRLHVLAFVVFPFVIWAAIEFGVGGASLSAFIIATSATVATAFGFGPFAGNSSFINAVLLDVLFAVLAISGLTLGAVIAERERAKSDREALIREQAAAETRLRLAAIVESSNDAIFSKSLDGIVLSWNAAAERIFGFAAADVIGRPASILLPPGLQQEENRLLQRFRAGERIDRYKTIRRTKAGNVITVSLTLTPVWDSARTLVGVAEIARDITEQERAEQVLTSVSRRLIHAQEQERARIARELHDDIGQRVALLAVELARLPGEPDRLHETLSIRLREQVVGIANDIQALSHELHSSKLELLGIAVAMKGFCQEFASQQQVDVDFVARDVPGKLSPEVSLCLFRVLQEALHNASKHSRVRHFAVQLRGARDEIHLLVSDAGVGFDLQAARTDPGLGLVSMEERLKLVSGELSIDTQPGRGTTIHAHAPYRS